VKLNRIEKALMNNPLRAFVQHHYEAPLLERLGARLAGKRVLEVGCGRGVGTEILLQRFGAREVYAFDLDPGMVAKARRRLARVDPDRVRVDVGTVTAIDAPDAAFDAVVDFGIIHHVQAWRVAVAEICRVLRPGGVFAFEEVTRQALERWVYRRFLDHPTADRFTGEEFVGELERQGIEVGGAVVAWCCGDIVSGVGRRIGKDREAISLR